MTEDGVRRRHEFEVWYEQVEPRLRAALVARYGPDRGRDAAAAALGWAWEHRDRLGDLRSPVAYLFRVGQSKARRRREGFLAGANPTGPTVDGAFEPGLPAALASLSDRQRLAVVLVHGHGWSLTEVAELQGIAKSTVQTHLERGMARVREQMGVQP